MGKKKKSKYDELCEDIMTKVKASAKDGKKPPIRTSKSDLVQMAQTLINSPDHTVVIYDKEVKEPDGTPLATEIQPAKRYRDSLKPMLRSMGIDRNELDAIDDIPFSKEHASALVDLATIAIKDYTKLGRRFNFPLTSLDESQMSLTQVMAPERTYIPSKTKDDESAGVPSGRPMTTCAHYAMKCMNRNPSWTKTYSDL